MEDERRGRRARKLTQRWNWKMLPLAAATATRIAVPANFRTVFRPSTRSTFCTAWEMHAHQDYQFDVARFPPGGLRCLITEDISNNSSLFTSSNIMIDIANIWPLKTSLPHLQPPWLANSHRWSFKHLVPPFKHLCLRQPESLVLTTSGRLENLNEALADVVNQGSRSQMWW